MVYTEVKEEGKHKYYYRTISFREKGKVKKKRVYMGSDLNKKNLEEEEKKADKELNLLSSLLTEKEKEELEKIKKEYLSLPKSTKENRYEAFISLFTYDSTNIEGNTFTLQETSQLLFENITPRRSLREVNEVTNHKKAFDYLLKTDKEISKDLVLTAHELVVKDTLKPEMESQVGKYRENQVYIRGTTWIPPKPEEVPKEMASLISWYSRNKKGLHPLILATYFHSAFETIHPFIDGNGRVGRLLMNTILHRNNYPMINVPNKKKHKYYRALEESQVNGNLRPLVRFFFNLMKNEKIKF